MGVSCSACRRTAIEVIPSKDYMLHVVDVIVSIEEKLRRGEELSKTEHKAIKVATEMRKIPTG